MKSLSQRELKELKRLQDERQAVIGRVYALQCRLRDLNRTIAALRRGEVPK